MSNDVESRFDELLERVEKRARAARIISILLTVIPVVMGLAFLYITIRQVEKARSELAQTQQQIADANVELDKTRQEIEEKKKEIAERDKQVEVYGEVVRDITKDLPATDVDKRILKPNSTTAQLPPRIYVQIRDESQRGKTKEIVKKLEERGFLVPGIERVARGAGSTEVKFFKQAEKDEAEKITAVLHELGIRDARAVYVRGFENSTAIRPRHYEIWFAPEAQATPPKETEVSPSPLVEDGWCCVPNRVVFKATVKQCSDRRGAFFKSRDEAKRACQSPR
jgi:uncharacterized membrane-anchored protein YhcB (DUF1043 family)